MTLLEYMNELKPILDKHEVSAIRGRRKYELFDKEGHWLFNIIKRNGDIQYEATGWGISNDQLFDDLRKRILQLKEVK